MPAPGGLTSPVNEKGSLDSVTLRRWENSSKPYLPWDIPSPEVPTPPNGANGIALVSPQSLRATPPERVRATKSSKSASCFPCHVATSGEGRELSFLTTSP